MDAPRRTPPDAADPEFSPTFPARLRDFDPLEHQRMVVNPFLAVLGLVALAGLGRLAFDSAYPTSALLLVPPLVLLPQLIQYHCLDCGRTGPYPRRRGHACPGVLARYHAGRRSRFPSGWAQLVVWGWLLGAVAVLLAVAATT